LASGLASASVGCHAGAVVMDGLLRRRIPLLARRMATLLPAILVLAAGADPTKALVLSQVVLSFGIPFALVWLTARRTVMGDAVNEPSTTVLAGLIAGVVITLNVALAIITV
jgi:manganese transport protein